MPRILVTTNPREGQEAAVLLWERVGPAEMESEHFAHQLLERLGWAVSDAQAAERDAGAREPR